MDDFQWRAVNWGVEGVLIGFGQRYGMDRGTCDHAHGPGPTRASRIARAGF